jgi:hypothetical protein
MAQNPREPKAVKKLLAEAQARQAKKKPEKPPINAVHHTSASLWAKIRLRGKGGGGR